MLDLTVDLVTIAAVALAAGGLWFNVRATRRQANTELLLAFTARYERIMESLPANAINVRLDLGGEVPPESPDLSRCVLRYLNLSSEEHYLHERGYLDSEIWKLWECELQRTLQSPLFRREWRVLRAEYESYPAFLRYVDRVQSESPLANEPS